MDRLALFSAALTLIVVGVGAFLWADTHNVNPGWVFGAWAAVFFLLIVGWGYRRRFRDPAFAAFFLVWIVVHVTIYLLVLGYLGILYYAPAVVLELWIFYILAVWQFGPPPDRGL